MSPVYIVKIQLKNKNKLKHLNFSKNTLSFLNTIQQMLIDKAPHNLGTFVFHAIIPSFRDLREMLRGDWWGSEEVQQELPYNYNGRDMFPNNTIHKWKVLGLLLAAQWVCKAHNFPVILLCRTVPRIFLPCHVWYFWFVLRCLNVML